jgi:hypothetical protein
VKNLSVDALGRQHMSGISTSGLVVGLATPTYSAGKALDLADRSQNNEHIQCQAYGKNISGRVCRRWPSAALWTRRQSFPSR